MTIEEISAAISIVTPVILGAWFYYSQRQALSRNYFSEINGIYAGFAEPVNDKTKNNGVYAGVVLNIRDVDDKGFFKGQFDFGETRTEVHEEKIVFKPLQNGVHTFLGQMNFRLYRDKARHPLRPEENRIYKGTLFVVDRLDFNFENYKIDNYVTLEYDITHYREMEIFKFTLKKPHRESQVKLPETFMVYKRMGASFEPYEGVQSTVFRGETFSDKYY